MAAVIDYQNMHLTAHDRFMGGGQAKHLSLLSPLQLVGNALQHRGRVRPDVVEAGVVIDRNFVVRVFRGLPGTQEDPAQYRRVQMQQSEWTRDRRVEVVLRPLRYRGVGAARVGQEKGVDVLVALELVRLIERGDHDLVILFAHDTDLEPALEYALQAKTVTSGRVAVETCGWDRCKRITPRGGSVDHTYLSEDVFRRAVDPKDYT